MLTQTQGQLGEDKALDYLKQQGLKCLTRNYTCRLGEIDLIMMEKECIVFIEVRLRKNESYGGGIGSITPSKKNKIIKTAMSYLISKKLYEQYPLRFDVISIDGPLGKVTWIQNAFGADY